MYSNVRTAIASQGESAHENQRTQPALELIGLSKAYAESSSIKAVNEVNLSLPPKSFLVLLGPSGCGKSTLLRMLAGLEAPSEGSIKILGREVASGARGLIVEPGQRGLGLVFQSYALWPHMTVQQNVEWPLKVAKMPTDARIKRVDEVLKLLAIDSFAARYPSEISGGQQQRVAIARMLAPAPQLLLFDEPLSNLDAKLRVEMRAELLRVHRSSGATSVYVTHDQIEAMTMATHVAVMKDGRVEQLGSPADLLQNPASAFVATFVGTPAANVVPVKKVDGSYFFGSTAVCAAGSGPDVAQLLYRAEDLLMIVASEVAARPRQVPATLIEVAPMAGRFVSSVLCAGTRLSLITEQPVALDVGSELRIEFPEKPGAIFSADGSRATAGSA
jgi:iron(III) transport system ATP-binding protein